MTTERTQTCEERIGPALDREVESANEIMYRLDFDIPEDDLRDKDLYSKDDLIEIAEKVGEFWVSLDDKKLKRSELISHILEYTDYEAADNAWFEAPLSVSSEKVITVQMSWGGPSDEFEIHVDSDSGVIESITYIFKDWFDGARRSVNLDGNDDLVRFLQRFVDYETGNY